MLEEELTYFYYFALVVLLEALEAADALLEVRRSRDEVDQHLLFAQTAERLKILQVEGQSLADCCCVLVVDVSLDLQPVLELLHAQASSFLRHGRSLVVDILED